MTPERMNRYGSELLQKTYNDNCQITGDWERVESLKMCSLYLPYFINKFEVVNSKNDLLFDNMLNNVKLYFHPRMFLYMAIYDRQIIYHTSMYMIINRDVSSGVDEWQRIS